MLWVTVCAITLDQAVPCYGQSDAPTESHCASCISATDSEDSKATTKPFFSSIFNTEDFPPRWHCGTWDTFHGWLHIVSDLIIWVAYMAIPVLLIYFVAKKKTVPFLAIFRLFGLFILCCGFTHLAEAIMFWWPAYRLMGLLKAMTAVVSVATVIALLPALPKALALRTPAELEEEIRRREIISNKLRESESRLNRTVLGSANGLWEWEPETERAWFATRFKELLGFKDSEFEDSMETWIQHITPEYRQTFTETLDIVKSNHDVFSIDIKMSNQSRQERWIQVRGQHFLGPSGNVIVSGSILDVTQRYETQDRLRDHEKRVQQEHRLAAIGSLAGGVAHEFNNMLQVVNGYIDFAIDSIEADSEVHSDLTVARNAGDKAAKITRQLLNYSREDEIEFADIDLNESINDMVEIIKPLLSDQVEFQVICSPEAAVINGDLSKLSQVILNLCINARDAMPTGGTLILRTSSENAESVSVSISDSGEGIPEDIQSRIFDPFFTTKEVGRGTGMGLSVSQSIVAQHEGTLRLNRSDERGTEFIITLPRSKSPVFN